MINITHITECNPFNADSASGTLYWIAKSLREKELELMMRTWHVNLPQRLLPPLTEFALRCKQIWLQLLTGSEFDTNLLSERAHHLAKILKKPLKQLKGDVILTTLSPVAGAYLETEIPIVYWTDHIYPAIANFYPSNRFHHANTQWDGNIITRDCLHNAKRLIFSSEWAARTAVEFYGIKKNKIQVIPFGPNLDTSHQFADIKKIIQARSKKCIKLLFVGKDWYRKGGDIVLEVAAALHQSGIAVLLTIVGCKPDIKFLSYIKCEEFLSKNKEEEVNRLKQLYREAHFLFVPSRAESYGMVFCEANAFGVPCISTYVGGIPEIIKDGINGMTFSLETTVQQYCDYIVNLMANRTAYEDLALSAFNEYETRLNWKTACRQFKELVANL